MISVVVASVHQRATCWLSQSNTSVLSEEGKNRVGEETTEISVSNLFEKSCLFDRRMYDSAH